MQHLTLWNQFLLLFCVWTAFHHPRFPGSSPQYLARTRACGACSHLYASMSPCTSHTHSVAGKGGAVSTGHWLLLPLAWDSPELPHSTTAERPVSDRARAGAHRGEESKWGDGGGAKWEQTQGLGREQIICQNSLLPKVLGDTFASFGS